MFEYLLQTNMCVYICVCVYTYTHMHACIYTRTDLVPLPIDIYNHDKPHNNTNATLHTHTQVQRSGSFDPTEFAGSDDDSSEFASENDDGECGIGVSVCKDERGFFRITEVVMGGAAQQASALRVGDILRSVDGNVISVDMRSHQVCVDVLMI